MNAKAKGSRAERKIKDMLERDGWLVTKSGGSLGVADLIALKEGQKPQMLQVKAGGQTPYANFGPIARHELRVTAKLAGATAILVWCQDRQPPRFISHVDWP